jgi:ubiquinone/menaquinone biosynthesis C-methylase UbiE/glycosyltransferase involved in cell wall biosynthesis
MDLQDEERLEYYKKMTVHPSGISKDKTPHKAELTMTDADIEAFYSERYADVNVAAFLENERKERLFGLCNMVKPGESFLDIGCADGGHMNVLYQRGIHGIGLDLAVTNILRGREKNPHLKFVHGFAEEIPFSDNFFDVVLLGDVIEHFRNPRAVLSECLRVARTGLVICVPIKEEITEEHINPFSVDKILSLLNMFLMKISLYNPEGEIISKDSAVSGLNEFPWLLIRAEKSDTSDNEIKKYNDVYLSEIESRGKTELLANDQWKLGDFHSRDPTEIARFNLVSHLIEGNRVLEIGSGNGDSTISLLKTAREVVGVDISEPGIRDAYQYSKTQDLSHLPSFYVMDATALAFPDNTFDTVVIPEVIEHIRSSRKIFQEAIRVVRNGGRIIFSVPDGLLVPWCGHLRIFFKDTLKTELSQYSDTISWHDLPFKKWIIGSFFVKKEHPIRVKGPSIDILMPSYNGRSTIESAIRSVIDQTYTNWILFVINDGGEELGDIIEKFQDSRIRYISCEHKGKSHALNFGLQNSTGEYLSYLDDDDILYPLHLEELIRGIEKENAEFVYADWYEVSYNEHNTEFWRGIECRQNVTPDMLITQNYINHKCILHTRKLINDIGEYDEDLSILIDWDIIRRMAFKIKPVHIWSLTSERIRHYEKNILINRITGLWTRDKIKAMESVLRIINKTDSLGATTVDLIRAIKSAMVSVPYYQYPQLFELSQNLQTKDNQLLELSHNLQTKDNQLLELSQNLRTKDNQLLELSQNLQTKDNQIRSIQQEISIKDLQFQEITGQLESITRVVSEKDQKLQEIIAKAEILALEGIKKDHQLEEQTVHIHAIEHKISTLEKSIVWQLTMTFHTNIVERLLPQNTRRRKYYNHIFDRIRQSMTKNL